MDVDKIHPFSSTLGWHSLKVKGEVQTRKGLRWIPRHLETRKGVDGLDRTVGPNPWWMPRPPSPYFIAQRQIREQQEEA
ncbi:hypothetical protein RJ640_017510 [Escallonia rubra]|uniref:Uncharacterized protein n=1 Tax=Escallonia rubra TaxID=112253 RepID=A0AA88RAM7_9ASTE|nr:hypothetical protein RJ640_017510 [Escallonia rubra]